VKATHFVVGETLTGHTVYYTGGAGERWVSESREKAFVGWVESGAQVVAERFNRLTDIHGITFRAEAE
jgi:hypothetical protein